MNPIASLLSAVRNISNIYDRAPRSEFWWTLLALIAVLYAGAFANITLFSDGMKIGFGKDVLSLGFVLFYVSLFCLLISITVRRLHDTDKTGWYACLFILGAVGILVLVILCSRRGTVGANRFGLDENQREAQKIKEAYEEAEEFG